MKLGIYVGSFNPVHKTHINIVNYLLRDYLDKVYIVPTMEYWDKNNLISIEDRINMLKLYERDNLIIDTINNKKEYSYEVLRYYKEKFKNDDISLIIGADNLVNFDKWKNFEELKSYNLIIVPRNNIDINYHLNRLNINNYYIPNNLNISSSSSTYIRNNIKKGYTYLSNELDKCVYDYIIKNSLYY